jgi:hypothetical protein
VTIPGLSIQNRQCIKTCAAGSYSVIENVANCTVCETGKFQTATGQVQCLAASVCLEKNQITTASATPMTDT